MLNGWFDNWLDFPWSQKALGESLFPIAQVAVCQCQDLASSCKPLPKISQVQRTWENPWILPCCWLWWIPSGSATLSRVYPDPIGAGSVHIGKVKCRETLPHFPQTQHFPALPCAATHAACSNGLWMDWPDCSQSSWIPSEPAMCMAARENDEKCIRGRQNVFLHFLVLLCLLLALIGSECGWWASVV